MSTHASKAGAAGSRPSTSTAAHDEQARTDQAGGDQGDDEPETDSLGSVGSVVRLDNPEDGGQARYALVVSDSEVVDLPTAREHQLKTYKAG